MPLGFVELLALSSKAIRTCNTSCIQLELDIHFTSTARYVKMGTKTKITEFFFAVIIRIVNELIYSRPTNLDSASLRHT